jgi:hypothetical protein
MKKELGFLLTNMRPPKVGDSGTFLSASGRAIDQRTSDQEVEYSFLRSKQGSSPSLAFSSLIEG